MKSIINLLFISLLSLSLQAGIANPPLYVFQELSIYNIEQETILEWSAMEEGETLHFIVERAEDENAPFKEIGKVIAASNGTEIIYLYSDMDTNPQQQYRIKAIMKDGSSQTSEPLVFMDVQNH